MAPPARLLEIALALDTTQHPEALAPMLIGIPAVALDGSMPPLSRLSLVELHGPDPVFDLVGRNVPSSWAAVGLRAAAHARRFDDDPAAIDPDTHSGNVTHLLQRDGTAVTVLSFPFVNRIVLGPDTEIRDGRVPDACRRLLQLPTAPPPPSMTTFVLDSWLAVCARAATGTPGLTWPEVVAFHPAQPGRPGSPPPTPADVAMATERLGASLSWERFRIACIASDFTPSPNVSAEVASWMDAGMFARWVQGELPSREVVMDVLDAVLQPGATDRIWATLGLCSESG